MHNEQGRAPSSGGFPVGLVAIGVLMALGIWYVAFARSREFEEKRRIESYQAEERRRKARSQVDAQDAADQRALEKIPCITCSGRGLVKDGQGLRTCQDCNATGKMMRK